MRNAFKSIKRMKFIAFLIVLQLSISFLMVNSTSSIIDKYKVKLDGFSRLMNFNNTYLLRIFPDEKKINDVFSENSDSKKAHYFMRETYFISQKNIEKIKNNFDVKMFFNSPAPTFIPEKYYIEKYKNMTPENPDNVKVSSIQVDYNFINSYKLNIAEGRNFTKEDFDVDYKTTPIPIIVGLDYKEKLKVGDIIDYNIDVDEFLVSEKDMSNFQKYSNKNIEQKTINLKLKIIGFYADNDIPSMFTKSDFIDKVIFSNSYSIVPCIKNLPGYDEPIIIRDYGGFVEVNSPDTIDAIKKELEPELKEKGMFLKTTNFKEEYNKFYELMSRDVLKSSLLGVVLMIMSIIGITSVLLGELRDRKKEFGIRISCGANIKTLCKEMFFEIALMIGISSVISIGGMILKNLKDNNYESLTLGSYTLFINIFVMIFLILIISILPILKIRKMNPVDLVRGE